MLFHLEVFVNFIDFSLSKSNRALRSLVLLNVLQSLCLLSLCFLLAVDQILRQLSVSVLPALPCVCTPPHFLVSVHFDDSFYVSFYEILVFHILFGFLPQDGSQLVRLVVLQLVGLVDGLSIFRKSGHLKRYFYKKSDVNPATYLAPV